MSTFFSPPPPFLGVNVLTSFRQTGSNTEWVLAFGLMPTETAFATDRRYRGLALRGGKRFDHKNSIPGSGKQNLPVGNIFFHCFTFNVWLPLWLIWFLLHGFCYRSTAFCCCLRIVEWLLNNSFFTLFLVCVVATQLIYVGYLWNCAWIVVQESKDTSVWHLMLSLVHKPLKWQFLFCMWRLQSRTSILQNTSSIRYCNWFKNVLFANWIKMHLPHTILFPFC